MSALTDLTISEALDGLARKLRAAEFDRTA